ncbi:DUF2716 domain-containing protein [Clostridium botulinum]|nr:DUF2716 domain-containing protein [Clostridium botulinum]NFO91334.1 DUF2716 domain-containing protein [Clostridium botulinum]
MDFIYELLDDEEYNYVWEYVYKNLDFKPNMKKNVVTFKIDKPYIIYDISQIEDENIDNSDVLIPKAFLNCIKKKEFIYALDWHHSCFKYNPRKKLPPTNERFLRVEDSRYLGGVYSASFPAFYPDGDYYLFIVNTFEWGYLTHPWQKKIWVFGKKLIAEIEKIKNYIGFVRI